MDDFTIHIDLENITKGVDKSQKVLHAIEIGLQNAFEEMKDRIIEKLSENIDKYGLGNGSLKSHMVVEEIDDGFIISVDSDYAEYVEYGTGIVGSNNPHPKPINWQYDVNAHGDEGWKYIGDDGKLHWTKGMPSRPFMYDTWLWGARSFTPIFRKHINKEIKRVIH